MVKLFWLHQPPMKDSQNIGDFPNLCTKLFYIDIFRALSLLGNCYKLEETHRDVFIRMIMLFSLHNMSGHDDLSPSALM